MTKTSFSNDYRKCFFDPGRTDRRTHERTLTTPQRNTLLSVERTSSYHQFLKKHLIFHENTKPHQFLTLLINWYSATATLAVHHGTSSYHKFLEKHLTFALYRKCLFDLERTNERKNVRTNAFCYSAYDPPFSRGNIGYFDENFFEIQICFQDYIR